MQELKFDPARLALLPPDITPAMASAWGAFRLLTEDWTADHREDEWFRIIRSVRPDTDQIVFTSDDWARVIAAFLPRETPEAAGEEVRQ